MRRPHFNATNATKQAVYDSVQAPPQAFGTLASRIPSAGGTHRPTVLGGAIHPRGSVGGLADHALARVRASN